MFNFSVLQQSDIDMMKEPSLPKKKRLIRELTQTEAMSWTRFKKEQLVQLKAISFGQLLDTTFLL